MIKFLEVHKEVNGNKQIDPREAWSCLLNNLIDQVKREKTKVRSFNQHGNGNRKTKEFI